MAGGDGRPHHGTTRSYWLQRQKVLNAQFNQLLMETGDPEVITAMEEASKLLQQIKLEAVQQDALTLQYLVGRYTTACARMAQAAMEDVPGGKALLKDMETCEKVLMDPDTSILVLEDPYLRPEHDVDLSSIPPSSELGDEPQFAGCEGAAAEHRNGQTEDSEISPLLPGSSLVSSHLRKRTWMGKLKQGTACNAEQTNAHASAPEDCSDHVFGTTQSYWLNRKKELSSRFRQALMETGDPAVIAALAEADRLQRQINTEGARGDTRWLQYLQEQYNLSCAQLTQAAMEDVPGGRLLLGKMIQCERALRRRDTSAIDVEDPRLQPDHEGDQDQSAKRNKMTAKSDQGHKQHKAAQTKVPRKRRWLPWFAG